MNLGYDFDIDAVRAGAHRLFRVLDEHLWFREREGLDWVGSSPHPTIADLALFGDVALSEEGGRLPARTIRPCADGPTGSAT